MKSKVISAFLGIVLLGGTSNELVGDSVITQENNPLPVDTSILARHEIMVDGKWVLDHYDELGTCQFHSDSKN